MIFFIFFSGTTLTLRTPSVRERQCPVPAEASGGSQTILASNAPRPSTERPCSNNNNQRENKVSWSERIFNIVERLCNRMCQNAATVTERKKILKNCLAKNWPEKLKTCSKELRVKKSRSICSYVLVSVQMGILWNNICIESISINKSGAIQ